MPSSPRRALLVVQAGANADIDALAVPLARAVAASVRTRTRGQAKMTAIARAMVLADADDALRPLYGAFHGDVRSGLYRLVVGRAREAALAVLDAAVGDIRRRLRREPGLLSAIEREA